MSMLTVSGIGRLVDAPQVKDVNGSTVTEFRVAFGGDKERNLAALFCDAQIWGRSGEVFANYHGKGDPCYLTGRFELREWTGREGDTRTSPTIRVADWTFTGSSTGSAKGDDRDSGRDRDQRQSRPGRR